MFRCYLALGSNLGDRIGHIEAGILALGEKGVRVLRSASVYATEPLEMLDQPWFLNTAIEAETGLDPETLIGVCLEIEKSRDRKRTGRNSPRTLDIDLILFEDRIVDSPCVKVPHPRYAERRFVLEPLAEIAFDRVDPVRKQTVGQLLNGLRDTAEVHLFTPPPAIIAKGSGRGPETRSV